MHRIPINESYTEIVKLRRMLIDECIPHECSAMYDGMMIQYTMGREKYIVASVVEYCESEGHESDRLELRGLLTPQERKVCGSLGNLTAEQVFARIKEHAQSRRRVR